MLCGKSLAALLLACGGQMLQAAEPVLVPTPRATALASSAANRPFLAAARAQQAVDLAARGYAETEHAMRGQHAGEAYVTRILVRRPLDAGRFSGRVIVEPLDVSAPACASCASHESASLWGFSWEYFLRRGDAWVGVTVSVRAVETLKKFNPARYAALTLGTAGAQLCVQPLVGDVLAQAGALLRSSSKENPLLGLNPQRLVAAGHAGAGNAISAFAVGQHRQLRLGDAAPVFDSYLVASATMEPASAVCGPSPSVAAGMPYPHDVTFIGVQTEPAASGTPATDAEAPALRLYDVAGSLRARPLPAGLPGAADLATAGVVVPEHSGCREPLMDRTLSYAMNAVWQQLDDWLLLKQPMVNLPRMTAADGGTAGGWRLPQVDLPLTGTAPAMATGAAGRSPAPCDAVWGTTPRLDAATLKSLYRDRNEYLRRFNTAVDQALAERLLVKEDAAALKAMVTRTLPVF